MLFLENEDKLIIFFQHEHGDLAGQIAAHWGNERFTAPVPFEETVYAASLHDMSWVFWDYYPTSITTDHKPVPWYEMRKYAFQEFSRFYGIQITGVGPHHPYAELLLAMHSAGLYKGRYGTQPTHSSLRTERRPEWQDDLDRLEKLQQDAKQRVLTLPGGSDWVSDKVLWSNYRLLEVWDRLSQYFIGRDDNIPNSTINPVPLSYAGDETQIKLERGINEKSDQPAKSVTLFPYPFTNNPQVFFIRAVLIPNKAYSDERELAKAILQGQRQNFEINAHDAS
jgi:hypothetical protein